MIITVLNGWGSSSRNSETRTAALVREATEHIDNRAILAKRSMLIWTRARRFRRFILSHQDELCRESLLCVGKSLGAKNMVEQVLNRLPGMLKFRKIGLFTIDPCWPIKGNWKPNLNKRMLQLTRNNIDRAVNMYAIRPPDEQAGARLFGVGETKNYVVEGVDHYSIVQSDQVAEELGDLVEFLEAP